MEKLNTMNSFEKEGFKIIRDGKIITLTSEEMARFRYLDIAVDGKNSIECAEDSFDDDAIIQKMKNNEKMCYDIEESILEDLFSDCGDTEYESIKKYYDEIVKQNSKKAKKTKEKDI